jgi:hypothetical protein
VADALAVEVHVGLGVDGYAVELGGGHGVGVKKRNGKAKPRF